MTEPHSTVAPDPARTLNPQQTADAVTAALRSVIDPEVGLDVVTLGLIYDVDVQPDRLRLVYTLTTPGCPLSEYMRNAIEHAVQPHLAGRQLDAELTFDPAWSPERIEGGAW